MKLLELAKPALEKGEAVEIELPIINTDRTVGTILSNELAKAHGAELLPEDTVKIKFNGSAGQSLGAFLAKGVSIELEGDANDYVGKGLSGGKLTIYPPKVSTFAPEENILVGNVCLYGATHGKAFFRGCAAERFCVRNSGASAVIEGVGDHGCEYMTGGRVVILGETGRNFAAGMSGGIAYVYDPDRRFEKLCNLAQVDVLDVQPGDGEGADKSWGRPQQRGVSVENFGMGDPLYHDAERVKVLVERHLLHTGSARAKALLDDWANELKNFRKVMPRDYARALKALEEEREQAAMEAAE